MHNYGDLVLKAVKLLFFLQCPLWIQLPIFQSYCTCTKLKVPGHLTSKQPTMLSEIFLPPIRSKILDDEKNSRGLLTKLVKNIPLTDYTLGPDIITDDVTSNMGLIPF